MKDAGMEGMARGKQWAAMCCEAGHRKGGAA